MESDTTELSQRETVFPTAWSSGTMAPGTSQESGAGSSPRPDRCGGRWGARRSAAVSHPPHDSSVLTPTVPDVLGRRGRLALRPFLETRGPEPELTTVMTPSVPAAGHCC